jgi:steroid 5-alpha reductase family enzyme
MADVVMPVLVRHWPYASFPLCLVACSGGLNNIIYAFGLGYGFSMTINGACAALVATTDGKAIATAGAAGCGLYAAYGVRLVGYLWRRQCDQSYAAKFSAVQDKSDGMHAGVRAMIVTSVALIQALYVLPLNVAVQVEVPAGSTAASIRWAGVGLAAAGLLFEAVADEQKLVAKRAHGASVPVTGGLYAVCRHPNYLGEIVFHLGVCGLAAGGSPLQIAAAVVSPLMMVQVMTGAAKRLDKEGQEKYGGDERWQKWHASTPSLMPRNILYFLAPLVLLANGKCPVM